MSRSLGAAFEAAATSQETAEHPITLVTLTHAGGDIRLCDNNENVISNGVTFFGSYVRVNLLGGGDTGVPKAKILIGNVSRVLIREIRVAQGPIVAKLELVLFSNKDNVLLTQPDLTLRNVTYDALGISADMQQENLVATGYPKYLLTPELFPGLF